MADFYNQTTHPKAAKAHRCIYCYAPIPKGEPPERILKAQEQPHD